MNNKVNILVVTNEESKTIGICQALETDSRIAEIFPAVSSEVNDIVAKDAYDNNAVIVYSGITNNISDCAEKSASSINISGGVDMLYEGALQLYKKRKDLQKQAQKLHIRKVDAIGNIFSNMLLDQTGWVEQIVNSLCYIPTANKPIKISDLIYALEERII